MRNRILKIFSFVFALILIAGVLFISNAFAGNPISKALATNAAQKHLEKNYSDQNFLLEDVSYNFKDGYYHGFVYDPNSMDRDFSILIDIWGKVRYDTYEDRVLSGRNTADRISMDYRAAVDTVLESRVFPYSTNIGYGDFEMYPRDLSEDETVPAYALITDDLIIDSFYDVNELGAKHGKLTIYIDSKTVSYEELSKILLEIKKMFDDAGVKFYVIDCVLEYQPDQDGKRKEARVEVREFLYADIYEDEMVQRVKVSDEAARAYYKEQDAEKSEEIL